ncbi:MAG TPA: hypothetical protein VGY49_06175 [Burkholderiaceae bacterium]|jgi:hypothetical protein|nr:hypothetical protein [Burkholderiaceae bacterium]
MASKKPPRKRAARKGEAANVRSKAVLVRAEKEVRQLLKQERAGTLTRKELESGLEEIRKQLEVMLIHYFYI